MGAETAGVHVVLTRGPAKVDSINAPREPPGRIFCAPARRRRHSTACSAQSNRTVVVVGAQWGDEGKGQARRRARRARRLGRALSGRRERRAHRRPRRARRSCCTRSRAAFCIAGVRCAIGNGVVLDPETLFTEIDELVADGIDVEGRLYVSDRAHLVLPYHKLVDARELALAVDRHDGARHRPGVRGQDRAARRARARSAQSRRGCASSSTQRRRARERAARGVRQRQARRRRRRRSRCSSGSPSGCCRSPRTSGSWCIAR